MKHLILYALLIVLISAGSCNFLGEKIVGNGKASSETRHVNNATKISVTGSIDVVIQLGAEASVKVEADENIIPYIATEGEGDGLKIRTKDNTRLSSQTPIKVYVTTPEINNLKITGSGNIMSSDKFTSTNKISFSITGSGDISANINAPDVDADITGSGNLDAKGETKNLEVDIKGSGEYRGAELKAENASVEISGSGDATVFADATLKAQIRGSGNIKYRGNASVTKSIAGSGGIQKIN